MLIFDADGLIKLHRAGILEEAIQWFQCIIPTAVYDEAVIRGKEHGYPDAEEIDRILGTEMVLSPAPSGEALAQLGLGSGETSALELATLLGAESIIITDDRQFQGLLTRQGIPFMAPTALLVAMARQGLIDKAEAREALERLRLTIRHSQFHLALQDLDRIGAQS